MALRAVISMKLLGKVGFSALVCFVAWRWLGSSDSTSPLPAPEEFVRSHGYPVEVHEVQSEDGYIQTLYRIPHGREQPSGPRRPVFIQHGVAGSSYVFIGLGPNASIGFILADEGYDVWLGNSRGSRYSLKHVSYNTSDSKFWDFSWQEMGLYELPAAIDYVLNVTNREKLTFIGHSLGATILAALLSSKPEYNNKIDIFIGLAPGLSFEKTNCHLFQFFGNYYSPFLINLVGHGDWGGSTAIDFYKHCHPGAWSSSLCPYAYYLLGPSTQLRTDKMHMIYEVSLSTASLKTLSHCGQLVYYGKFLQYHYGESENMKVYGTAEPPEYDIKKVTIPTFLFYSESDNAIIPEVIEKAMKLLPNAKSYKVQLDTFNHLDFLFGKDVFDLVYKQVLKILDETITSKEITSKNVLHDKIPSQVQNQDTTSANNNVEEKIKKIGQ